MIIRQEQIEVFNAVARENFEEDANSHVRQFAPKHTEVLGEEGTRRVVRAGMQRAGRYGFTSSGPLHFFLEMVFTVGSEFDTDPQYPWASQILNDPTIPGPMPRADRLHERSSQYLDQVMGPEYEFGMQALQRLKVLDARTLGGAAELTDRFEAMLRSIYPQKAGYLGRAGLQALIHRGLERVGRAGINSEAGAMVFVALEYTLGHAFERDPLHPWIAATLSGGNAHTPEERVRRLYQKAKIYVDHSVQYLEQGQNGKV